MAGGPAPKRHQFRGEMLTVREIAARIGLTEIAVYRRIQLGQSLDYDRQNGSKPLRYQFNGASRTTKEIAAILGVCDATVKRHIRAHGWNVNRPTQAKPAIIDPDLPENWTVPPFTIDGRTPTRREWERRIGIFEEREAQRQQWAEQREAEREAERVASLMPMATPKPERKPRPINRKTPLIPPVGGR